MKKILLIIFIAMVSFENGFAQNRRTNQKQTTKKATTTKKKVVASAKKTTVNKPPVTKKEVEVKDTSKPDVVILYAAFKPTLRNAAKLNFTAATPVIDTTKIPLTYVVPAQNLFFSYQPVAIKPLALFVDSSFTWQNNQYIKVGYGNFASPYIEAGAAFGDGKKSITTLHAKHTSSKGNLPFQQFSKTGLELLGIYNNNNNQEFTTKVFYDNSVQYFYGYEPSNLTFTKEQLQQQFNTIGMQAALNTKMANSFGITYHPSIGVNYFFDNRDGKEINFLAKLPINKAFGRMFAFDLSVTADITSFKSNSGTIKNNLFYLNPTIQFKTPNFKLNVGIQPTWDNQINSILPNVTAEAKINGEKFVIQAGWVGSVQKNSYQSLAAINPWLRQPTSLFNTEIKEQYAGFKGSGGNHFSYNARVSFLKMQGQPLFVNDAVDGKTFIILNEANLQAIRIHGEVGYSIQEKFSFLAAATINQFTKSVNDKPFGLLPLELTGTLKWKVLKDLHFKSDIFFWDGSRYLSKSMQTQKLDAALDLNVGVEYSILPKLNLWLQFNNLLNNQYQRWNQYQVLGFNVIGGVVYSFR